MTRVLLVLAAALCVAPPALADGIAPFAQQGGPGVLSPDGASRYVAVAAGRSTTILRIDAHDGGVVGSVTVAGAFGVPVPTYTNAGEGISHDGGTLVVADLVRTWPHAHSAFLFIDPQTLEVRDRVALAGDFSFDALDAHADRLYLIQHVSASDTSRYVVREFDVATMRLLPGRIADRTQRGWVMAGYPLNRVTSADGRWVYTLYSNPDNVPFVHALDSERGVAHCIGLPLRSGDQSNLLLALRDGGRTLAVHWLSGRRWVKVDTASWRISEDRGSSFPWWVLGFALLLPPLLLVRRRRRAGVREPALST
jgi:hypothetical protein